MESTFYGRDKTEDDPESLDMHMTTNDFKLIGEDLAKTFINFLPIPRYQKKINYLYKKFLEIIHEEALKCCLPYNQDRYLKRNYRSSESADPTTQENNSTILGPSLEELEGKPLEPEGFDDNSSLDDELNTDFSIKMHADIERREQVKIEVKEMQEDIQVQQQEKVLEEPEVEEDFIEFQNVLNCVEEFEHHKALEKSDKSSCDDSDSDDEEANLITKKLTKLSRKNTLKKISKPKQAPKPQIKASKSLKKSPK